MSAASETEGSAHCLDALERAMAGGAAPDLTGCGSRALDAALRELVKRHGADAVPLVRQLADAAPSKDLRKVAKLAVYRLGQAGIAVPPASAAARPVVARSVERPVRAWLSGIDGSGSRAVWILFEGGLGAGLSLCSLILNDESGILEAAGGPITRKRLERELASLREHQKLPWVDSDPGRAIGLVAEALQLHRRLGTEPPPAFARWRRVFATAPAHTPEEPATAEAPEPGALERSAELTDLSELAGWFVEPALVQEDALALLQARESRLVVSEQIKAERETAIIDGAIDRVFAPDARRRWARRLAEMATIFRDTGRSEPARMAAAAAAALADQERSARAIPLVRALTQRGIEMASEVALGRAKLSEVSRAAVRPAPS
jgi:hypothetical protein